MQYRKSPGSSSLPEAESNMLLEDDLDLKDMVALESKKSQSVPNTGAIPKSTSTVAKPAMVNSEHPKQIEELEKKLTKAQEEKQQLQKVSLSCLFWLNLICTNFVGKWFFNVDLQILTNWIFKRNSSRKNLKVIFRYCLYLMCLSKILFKINDFVNIF